MLLDLQIAFGHPQRLAFRMRIIGPKGDRLGGACPQLAFVLGHGAAGFAVRASI